MQEGVMKEEVTDREFIEIVKGSISMNKAREALGIPQTTFICRAKKLGIYVPNRAAAYEGRPKVIIEKLKDNLREDNLITGTAQFKRRLIEAGLLENVCYRCNQPPEWQGEKLVHHLDHINGVKSDNRIDNLRILCPNCHSQTENYTGRNTSRQRRNRLN
jgi:5-methylcytosine-specific restriction endonuclease McrA